MPSTLAQPGSAALDAADLTAALGAMLAAVRAHEAELNRLNVFPVADHDTGTNLAVTLAGVVAALDRHRPRDLRALAAVVAETAPLEASGNAGVILAEALRGLVEPWASLERIGPADLALGLRSAADRVWAAVLDPLEGTILSVARAAADAVDPPDDRLAGLAERAASAAGRAVTATRRQLPALRKAGVVDAGGRGYQLCLRALAATAAGRAATIAVEAAPLAWPPAVPAATSAGQGGPGFEVQYLVACGAEAAAALKATLGRLGESVAVAQADGRWRVHVHTDQAGAAIEAALRHGVTTQIQVACLHRPRRRGIRS